MTPNIKKAKQAVDEAEAHLKDIVRMMQKRCKHRNLVETPYEPDSYGGFSHPPLRMCCTCGMTEVGWGPGYVVLKGAVHLASREAIYRQRMGLVINDDDKGPLLRKEITLDELIDNRESS